MTPLREMRAMRLGTLRRAAVLFVALPWSVSAQSRLVNSWTASTGVVYEHWSLPTAIATTGVAGGTSLIAGASQLTIPVALVVPIRDGWSLDAYSAYAMGEVRLASPDNNGRRRYRLDGPTDTRLRLVGNLIGESLLLSVGVAAPTGKTKLNGEEINALNVIAAPGLRFRSPFLGTGPGATVGLIWSRPIAGWGVALGSSYEARGTYAPAAAIQVGLPTTDLRPGNATHFSVAAERLTKSMRHLMSVAGDLYQAGELRAEGTGEQSTLALGPSVTGTYQLDAAIGSWPVTAYVVGRYRSEFTLGGETLAGSGRTEAEGGFMALRNLNSRLSFRLALEGRKQSTGALGTTLDDPSETPREVGFGAAGITAGGATLSFRLGGSAARFALEPFGRVQAGRMDFGTDTRTVTGISGGATLSARF